ncbi:hypothetical protein BSKO_00536 [Bryopsis sp. KO-2023]|nr:hypothetical protein BSKO_00536 [Bryopsis sp. KO-2023]
MNGGIAKLGHEGERSMKRWWTTDQRLRSANAHKIPKGDPSLSPSNPHYLSQTCSALVKRKTFKRRAPPAAPGHLQKVTLAKSRIPLRPSESPVAIVVTENVIDEAVFSPVKIADPLYTPGVEFVDVDGIKSPRRARGRNFRAFSLLKSVPENDEGLVRSMAGSNSCSMDSGESQSTRISQASSVRQPTKSEAIIGGFKEFLGQIKRNRPRYVDDIAISLEDLWCTGKLGDLADLENMWPIAVSPVPGQKC